MPASGIVAIGIAGIRWFPRTTDTSKWSCGTDIGAAIRARITVSVIIGPIMPIRITRRTTVATRLMATDTGMASLGSHCRSGVGTTITVVTTKRHRLR